MDSLRQDVAFALRGMVRRPGFTVLVVATLALGIGANAAIFSVVKGLLIAPLPFEEGERLVLVDEREESGHTASVSFPNYRDWKARTRSFDRFSIIQPASLRFTGGPEGARIVEAGYVGGGFFETLALEPELGRQFTEEESEPGADRIAVLGHAFWVDVFGADPAIVGRTIQLGGAPFVVVGVQPADFVLYEETGVFLPLGVLDDLPWNDRGTSIGAEVIARLAPGTTAIEAQSELRRVAATIANETGEVADAGNVTPLRAWFIGDAGRQSLLLLAAVGLVLLVACANVASLLFVASERRVGEMALRSALGASRWRVYRQLLTESVIVALVGGAAGLALGRAAHRALLALVADLLPAGFVGRMGFDLRVLGYTAGITVATALLAGFLPALRAGRAELASRIRRHDAGATGSGRARNALVLTEVALSMILLVGAGLLISTLAGLQNVDKGFDGGDILTLRLQTPDDRAATREEWTGFHARLREEIAALPGVVSVATSNHFPLSGNSWEMRFRDEGTAPDDRGESVLQTMVSPSFFDTYGVEILEGRAFTEADRWGMDPVVIVDETLAAARFPGESALGRRVAFEKVRGANGEEVDLWRTVIGVAHHVRHYELSSPSRIEVYTPFSQSNAWGFTSYLSVRSTSEPGALSSRIRSLVAEIEPDATLYRVRTVDSLIEEELGLPRAMSELLSAMAVLALLLGCVGIYSVVSHSTALRLRELSLRIALGGQPARITRMVLRDSLVPIVAGVAVGGVGASALGRLLRSVLYEVGPSDPRVLSSAGVIMLVVGVASAWIPARRAARIPPQHVLRGE